MFTLLNLTSHRYRVNCSVPNPHFMQKLTALQNALSNHQHLRLSSDVLLQDFLENGVHDGAVKHMNISLVTTSFEFLIQNRSKQRFVGFYDCMSPELNHARVLTRDMFSLHKSHDVLTFSYNALMIRRLCQKSASPG